MWVGAAGTMRFERPKSILGLVLIGFSLVALPLLVAVVRASFHVDKFAEQSQHLVVQGIEVTQLIERLAEYNADIERFARQYYVVRDSSLWASYYDAKLRFAATLESLGDVVTAQELVVQVEKLQKLNEVFIENTLPAVELTTAAEGVPPALLERFSERRQAVATLAHQSHKGIENSLELLEVQAAATRRRLMWQSAMLLPITIALGAVFTILIARPIRELTRAIAVLGEGDLTASIAVSGPPELRTLGARLDWLRRRLQTADETKATFLRHVSHELKTPLASLREGTELLTDGALGPLDPTQAEVASILRDNCLLLQSRIENLLDFSAWQQGVSRLHLSRFDLSGVVDDTIARHQLAVKRKSLTVTTRGSPVHLLADRAKLAIAVDNLLANAIKYSPDGGEITISISCDDKDVHIEIHDEGPGIAPSDRDRVFEPFYQGAPPEGAYVRGTGIGLSVVYECARAHSGHIALLDDAQAGGRFRLSIPIDTPEKNVSGL